MKNLRGKILIFEDEGIIGLDIKQILQKAGYEIPPFIKKTDEAVSLIEKEKPDLVLIDLPINEVEIRFEMGRHITERFNIPVIFLTSLSVEETMKFLKLSTQNNIIPKPFEGKRLLTSIEQALHKN